MVKNGRNCLFIVKNASEHRRVCLLNLFFLVNIGAQIV